MWGLILVSKSERGVVSGGVKCTVPNLLSEFHTVVAVRAMAPSEQSHGKWG